MKNGIPADMYYFLLEWKDANMEEFINRNDGRRMCDLTTYELNKLYEEIKANEVKTSTERKVCECKEPIPEIKAMWIVCSKCNKVIKDD